MFQTLEGVIARRTRLGGVTTLSQRQSRCVLCHGPCFQRSFPGALHSILKELAVLSGPGLPFGVKPPVSTPRFKGWGRGGVPS